MQFYFRSLIIVVFISVQALRADVRLSSIFSDHMVIQRETNMPVWGWADPHEEIEIYGSWGKKAKAIADKDGAWQTKLKTPKAGGPFTITVKGKNTLVINDVLAGEVWLCTGQSNMDFALEKFLKDSRDSNHQPLVEMIRNEVTNADDDHLRHIEVLQNTSIYKKQTDFKGKWISAKTGTVGKITATGYFFAKELRKKLNVPVGLVECSWGGTRVQPWISEEAYMQNKNLRAYFNSTRKEINKKIETLDHKDYVDGVYEKKLAKWKEKGAKGRKPKPATHPTKDSQVPATLYNGMLNAIIPYAIKGAIWYQGESNAVYMPNDYQEFFTTMVKSWRQDWGQGNFPFYWVQLAACQRKNTEADHGWATVNNHLRKSLVLPNTGMAVLYDIGEPKDIHPHNKMDAGKRLSYWALSNDYHIKTPVVSGPLYQSKKIKENKIQIKFSKVGTGLIVAHKHLTEKAQKVNEPLKWFEIQDSSGKWWQAHAEIITKNKISVWNTNVASPKNVRYAWSGNPEGANLYNKEGLPAAVFSTED